ncbi:MAG TPA: nicotinate-nucleotide adenylyltransferase [Candidatus Deferrimicrobiaceae bacterium]|nr:nicotinate-nucleotide adenylyltransferase [Candidatus Deferrimicrobiaceae bacterium]
MTVATSSSSRPSPARPGSQGILGGTFDPIHLGHLASAEEAREALGLERVLFVPNAIPPFKLDGTAASAADRLAMTRLAITGNPAFEVSTIELERGGVSYTADTVEALAAAERAAGRQPDLTLILSAETLRDLPGWHEPARLLAACRIAVVPREGYPAPDPDWLRTQLPGVEQRVAWLDGPRLEISSTAIRERIAAGRSIRYLVPPVVERYVADHQLYRRTDHP